MTSLVTGHTGFIGRHLLAQLAQIGQRVRAFCTAMSRSGANISCMARMRSRRCVRSATMHATASLAGRNLSLRGAPIPLALPRKFVGRIWSSVQCLLEAVRSAAPTANVVLLSSLNVLGNES